MAHAPTQDTFSPLGGPSTWSLFISSQAMPSRIARRDAAIARFARFVDAAAFGLLMLAIGVLLFRPADIVPALEGVPLYETCVIFCILAAWPRVLPLLTSRSLGNNALITLALAFVPAVVLSNLSHANTWDARMGGAEAGKACILFLLIAGLVHSIERFRALLLAALGSVLAVTILAILNYYGLVSIPALTSVVQRGLDESGPAQLLRICGTGIFNDPNDYSLVLVLCMAVCAYLLEWRALGRRRWLILIPLFILGHGLILTHSRGGLMSAVAATVAYIVMKFGWRNALPAFGIVAILVLAPFWGRQTTWNMSNPSDTFQARLSLWSSSLDILRDHPLFGIGQGKLTESIGQVTHNSFLHAFAELGLVGGLAFFGAFCLAIRYLMRARPVDAGLLRLQPCIVAITVGYAAGMLALSRCYTAPVQLILALSACYLRLASTSGAWCLPRVNTRTVGFIAGLGALFLIATYVFVRIMLNRPGM